MKNQVIHGECLEELKKLPENSVDSIVTDPPYGLSFMGKKWDYDVPSTEIWQECLRVLKPGGYLLAFAGTRTQHRMAVRIEDAGFEIRDMIAWVYGSGFPKSLNIGKAIDKLQGNKRGVIGKIAQPGSTNTRLAMGNGLQEEPDLTKGNSEWEGWGTALKPALEPITVARKPLSEKTVAENCLKWGTGGINIDESRVETSDNLNGGAYSGGERSDGDWKDNSGFKNNKLEAFEQPLGRFPANLIHDNSEEVRECFPETKSGNLNSGHKRGDGTGNSFMGGGGVVEGNYGGDSGNASRFFKSIIYQAKASKSERNKGCEYLNTTEKFTAGNYSQSPTCKDCEKTLNGTNDHSKCSGEVYYKEMESKNTKNNHPTVKPIALMEYLVKLVTKQGGTVLDPFAGSGSTLIAAEKNNYNYIGIEMEADYIDIINARLKN